MLVNGQWYWDNPSLDSVDNGDRLSNLRWGTTSVLMRLTDSWLELAPVDWLSEQKRIKETARLHQGKDTWGEFLEVTGYTTGKVVYILLNW